MNNNLPLEIEFNIIKFMRHPAADALNNHMVEMNKLDLSSDDSDDYESYFYPFYKVVLRDIKKAKRLKQRIKRVRERDLLEYERSLGIENDTPEQALAWRRQLALSMTKYTIT